MDLDDLVGGSAKNFVAMAKLKVRSACDKDAPVVYEIFKGEVFAMLEERGDWMRVDMTVPPHPEAWVQSKNKIRSLVESTTSPPTVVGNVGSVPTSPAAGGGNHAGWGDANGGSDAPPLGHAADEPTPAQPSFGSSFYRCTANMNVRERPDSAADPLTDVGKGDIICVEEVQGDWFRLSLRGRSDVWILSRNKVRSLVEPVDPGEGLAAWQKAEAEAKDSPEEEEAKKKEEEQRKHIEDEKKKKVEEEKKVSFQLVLSCRCCGSVVIYSLLTLFLTKITLLSPKTEESRGGKEED